MGNTPSATREQAAQSFQNSAPAAQPDHQSHVPTSKLASARPSRAQCPRPSAERLLSRMHQASTRLTEEEIDVIVRFLDGENAAVVNHKGTKTPYISTDLELGTLRNLSSPQGPGDHAALEHFDLEFQEQAFRFVKSDHRIEQGLRHNRAWIPIQGVTRRLYHHQLYAAFWLLVHERGPRRGAFLADSMGLGKTTTAYLYILLNFLLAENLHHIRRHPGMHRQPSQPPHARCPVAHFFPIECACQESSVTRQLGLEARDGASLVIVPAGLIGSWEAEFAKLGLEASIPLRLYVHHRQFTAKCIPRGKLRLLHLHRSKDSGRQPMTAQVDGDYSGANPFVVLTSVESYHDWVYTYCGNGARRRRAVGSATRDSDDHGYTDGLAWARVLRDEAHLTPNPDTRLYQILDGLADSDWILPNFVALTGTPMLRNGVRDMQALVQVINRLSPQLVATPGFDRFCRPGQLTQLAEEFLQFQARLDTGRIEEGARPTQDSVRRLLVAYCIRRHAHSLQNGKVLAYIPPLDCFDVSCPSSDTTGGEQLNHVEFMLKKKLSQTFQDQLGHWQATGGSAATFHVNLGLLLDNARMARILATVPGLIRHGPRHCLTWGHIQSQGWHVDCRRSIFYRDIRELEAGSGKLQALRRFVDRWKRCTTYDGTLESLVIVSEFAVICHIVICFLTRLGVSCAWMHADLSSQSKQQLVDKFQEPSRHGGIRRFRVMVGASRILGQGVTLTRAHRLILMEPSHHAAVEAQNADRTHRLGSMTDRCRFYRFLNPDSRLERMLVLAQQGQRSLHHAVEWMDALAVTDSVAVADEPGLAELMTTPDDWAQDSAGW